MNKLKKILLVLSATLATVLVSHNLKAHHSTSAFDSSSVIKIEGTITRFRWTNPHASIKLEGTAEGALDGLWTVEMTAPNILINSGWKRSSLKKGDSVTIFVNPLRNSVTLNDGSQGGLYVGAILADGSTRGTVDGTGRGSSR